MGETRVTSAQTNENWRPWPNGFLNFKLLPVLCSDFSTIIVWAGLSSHHIGWNLSAPSQCKIVQDGFRSNVPTNICMSLPRTPAKLKNISLSPTWCLEKCFSFFFFFRNHFSHCLFQPSHIPRASRDLPLPDREKVWTFRALFALPLNVYLSMKC